MLHNIYTLLQAGMLRSLASGVTAYRINNTEEHHPEVSHDRSVAAGHIIQLASITTTSFPLRLSCNHVQRVCLRPISSHLPF